MSLLDRLKQKLVLFVPLHDRLKQKLPTYEQKLVFRHSVADIAEAKAAKA